MRNSISRAFLPHIEKNFNLCHSMEYKNMSYLDEIHVAKATGSNIKSPFNKRDHKTQDKEAKNIQIFYLLPN